MNPHPDVPTLQAFAAGRLMDPQADAVAEHLKQCVQCADIFATVSCGHDKLVEKLRRMHFEAETTIESPLLEESASMSSGSLWNEGFQPISGYTVVRRLGAGAFGEVWEATAAGGIPTALKRVDLKENSRLGETELTALELLKRVRHPHLLSMHGFWVAESTLIIACELADESLHSVASADATRVPVEQILRYLQDAAEALDYLGRPIHLIDNVRVRILHCDVKPANLLLQGGAVKVADFGLASPLKSLIEDRPFSGTPAFSPPEFFEGKVAATSDQYSLAITYYQLRTGKRPFNGSVAAIAAGHLGGTPNLEGLSIAEQKIVERALAKNPALRWDSCTKFIGELQRSHAALSSGQSEGKPTVTANAHTDIDGINAPTLIFQGKPITSGQMLIGDKLIPVPLKSTALRVAVFGAISEVKLTQVFVNTGDCTIEATYVFPLPEDAAVNRMRIIVDDRVIESEVRENTEAMQLYRDAKYHGQAGLLQQTSPGIFTSSIASILPGQEVRVEITYLQALPFDAGMYSLRVPLVVSDVALLSTSVTPEMPHGNDTAGLQRVRSDLHRGDTIQINVELDAGVPLCGFDSPSHDIETLSEEGTSRVSVRLRSNHEIPNRDFVLNYRVRGAGVEHALFYEPERDGEPGTFLLLTTPPATPPRKKLPRRIVFVLGGYHLDKAKKIALQLLEQLRPDDAFNLIAFGFSLSTLADSVLPATPDNLRRAQSFLQSLRSQGTLEGSEMLEPLQLALQQLAPQPPQKRASGSMAALRAVLKRYLQPAPDTFQDRFSQTLVYLNGGSMGTERELLAAIRPQIGNSRIIGVGIGVAAKKSLLNKLAMASGGIAEFLEPGENMAEQVSRILRRLEHPLMTNAELIVDKRQISELIPERIPDLYHELPLQIIGRFRGKVPPRMILRGLTDGAPCEYEIVPEQVSRVSTGSSLSTLWAHRRIQTLTADLWECPESREHITQQVISLAVRYRLASAFTAFVAVEHRAHPGHEGRADAVQVVVPQYEPEWAAVQEKGTRVGSFPLRIPFEQPGMPGGPQWDHTDNDYRVYAAYGEAASWSADSEAGSKSPATDPESPMAPSISTPAPVQDTAVGSAKGDGIRHKLSRVRKPRVCITYDVESNSAKLKKELPFVVGVMGDFYGTLITPLPPLAKRRFIAIDRDNFDDVMTRLPVNLHLRVPDRLNANSPEIDLQLMFLSMQDFEPSGIMAQVEPMRRLLQTRERLVALLSRCQANSSERSDGNEAIRQEFIELFLHDLKPDKDLTQALNDAVADVDARLSAQLSDILHHPAFQKLEGSWRGLRHLIMNTETGEKLKLRMLSVTKRELFIDLDAVSEFDLSALFKKIYEDEFEIPGGQPYGALIGDFQFTNHPEDINFLQQISHVAAAAFCPFISAADPGLLGFASWTELSRPTDIENIFLGSQYTRWNSFRDSENSRYVALVMPRVLARLPYGARTKPVEAFGYEEFPPGVNPEATGALHNKYCWMNAAYVMATNITRAVAETGWCTAIRGLDGGGKVENLPLQNLMSTDGELVAKCPTEIAFNDRREAELSKEGFLPLSCYIDCSVFFSTQTCQRPQKYAGGEKGDDATANAAISARLPYVMATSRIAHYLKRIASDRMGAFSTREDMEDRLNKWIADYVLGDKTASAEMKARYPLAEARIVVEEIPGEPGSYNAVVFLRPHLQLESLTMPQRMVVKLPPKRG